MPRPPSANPRNQAVNLRLTAAERDEVESMAAELGTTLSEALRDYGLRGLRSAVKRQRRQNAAGRPATPSANSATPDA